MLANSDVSEKEFVVIKEISQNKNPSQRIIAKNAGISLGLTNIIIRRLIKKGYIKIGQIPPKRVQYMLTPKGLAEKARKSYHFTLRTVNLIRAVNISLRGIILDEYKNGARDLTICGNGELASLAEIAARDLKLKGVKYFRTMQENQYTKSRCVILINKNDISKKIDLISELAKRGVEY